MESGDDIIVATWPNAGTVAYWIHGCGWHEYGWADGCRIIRFTHLGCRAAALPGQMSVKSTGLYSPKLYEKAMLEKFFPCGLWDIILDLKSTERFNEFQNNIRSCRSRKTTMKRLRVEGIVTIIPKVSRTITCLFVTRCKDSEVLQPYISEWIWKNVVTLQNVNEIYPRNRFQVAWVHFWDRIVIFDLATLWGWILNKDFNWDSQLSATSISNPEIPVKCDKTCL